MSDFKDDPFVQLQQARKAHRHAAHVYARTKKDSDNYDSAVQKLEHAAMMYAMAAMVFGSKADTAAPANGPARVAWEKAIDPEPDA